MTASPRNKTEACQALASLGIEPRGLSAALAAAYVGLSKPVFLREVAKGTFPKPRTHGRRKVWDKRALDAALDPSQFERSTGDDIMDAINGA